MVLVLANALELPLRERNTLLASAGFAAVYRESGLSASCMAGVRSALDYLLAQAEPYGAVVLDRGWNLQQANQGAMRLFAHFLEGAPHPNLMHGLFDPNGVRPFVMDWETVAGVLMERLHREARLVGGEVIQKLIAELLRYPDVPERFALPDMRAQTAPILPLHLKRGDSEVRLMTVVSTLGTPIDVTAEELFIESYFPADDASERFLKSLV